MNNFNKLVLYEDNHLLIINKPACLLVQGDNTGDMPLSELAKQYLKEKYQKPGRVFLGVVHRLDRPTSGVLIFARTSKALERMNKQFKERKVQKIYWAVVKKIPEQLQAKLLHYLKKDHKRNKSFAYTYERGDAKKAELTYRLIASSEHYHLLEVKPLTGRHHQIRVQLASIGSPIKGDLKYGFARSNSNGSIHLHARSITFIHPVKKESLSITAPCPQGDAIWHYFDKY